MYSDKPKKYMTKAKGQCYRSKRQTRLQEEIELQPPARRSTREKTGRGPAGKRNNTLVNSNSREEEDDRTTHEHNS